MSTRRVSRAQTRPTAQPVFQQSTDVSVNWRITVPELEAFSTLYIDSGAGRNFDRAAGQLWAKTEHAPDTLHYLAIPRGRPDELVIREKERLTPQKLKELVDGNKGSAVEVKLTPLAQQSWIEEVQKKSQQAPGREHDVLPAIKYMAQTLGVSPLFLDCIFIPRSALPFCKLSDWPAYERDHRFSAKTTELDGQHLSSTYVVHTIRHQTTSSAHKFFTRVNTTRSHRATRYSLLSFMAIDVLFSDMATAHSDLNTCYVTLKTALDSIDENTGTDADGIQERTKKYYRTLKDSYKVLSVLNTRSDDQVQTIKMLRALVQAYCLLDWDEHLLGEREQRMRALHCALDGMEMETNVLAGDLRARNQFFGTLMSLHLGALMQIDSSTSLSIARSSEKIAGETKKDGRSMKIIAIVTMFFLPASLVAGILDTPFFTTGDEVPGRLKVSPSFWILWVVSVPLTILVFAAWLSMPRIGKVLERASGPTPGDKQKV
ncbi:hypothetical protein FA13DRAFT_1715321 [Coprinellus micaceus]|uniref:Cora-domain-containing protein n=1 Tax=Coprinellus micaceus TaxID=71717 RepID=A0A4Y7SP11_COPMI|nr:hypothetical protein FA13DRAFT_1715321 [Coprinellus micaceus]